jgi:hypothetical protein
MDVRLNSIWSAHIGFDGELLPYVLMGEWLNPLSELADHDPETLCQIVRALSDVWEAGTEYDRNVLAVGLIEPMPTNTLREAFSRCATQGFLGELQRQAANK